jgi:hypothetical protein
MKLPATVFLFLFAKCLIAQINLDQGLVAYYPFDGNANDMSGNSNNPVFNNTRFDTDRFGKKHGACYFNGKNNYIQIKSNASLTPKEFSLVATIKPLGFYMGDCFNNVIIDKGFTDYIPGIYSLRFTAGEFTRGDCSDPALAFQNFVGTAYNNAGCTSKDVRVKLNTWYCLHIY